MVPVLRRDHSCEQAVVDSVYAYVLNGCFDHGVVLGD